MMQITRSDMFAASQTRTAHHTSFSDKYKNQRAVTFRSLDKAVLDELARHLNLLGYDFKRYAQSPGDGRKSQIILRIHKQDEVRRFCEEVDFRRKDRSKRAETFLAGEFHDEKMLTHADCGGSRPLPAKSCGMFHASQPLDALLKYHLES